MGIKNIIKGIPQKPGVYLFKDKTGRILYAGKAVNLRRRVGSYFKISYRNNFPQPLLMLRGGVNDIDWIETENENQAFLLENELIKKYHPRYNIQWQDDKSYFWVQFTDDEWPRMQIAHKLKTKNLSPGGRPPAGWKLKTTSIGPFTIGNELKQLLRALRKILPYRTCKNTYTKPCLQWHLGLCPAHRDSSKFQVSSFKFQSKIKNYLNSLNTLTQILRLYAGEPTRLEAYDISNIQGAHATGSMVVFEGAKPKKSDYRRFRIKTVPGANDVAMLNEVLRRRFHHLEWPYPDLILIDGGRAQLDAAKFPPYGWSPAGRQVSTLRVVARRATSFKLQVPIVALAKREEEIYTEYSAKPLRLSKLPESLRLTFQAIRDEAHRFAIFYYRHLHGKQFRANPKNIRAKGAPAQA